MYRVCGAGDQEIRRFPLNWPEPMLKCSVLPVKWEYRTPTISDDVLKSTPASAIQNMLIQKMGNK